MRVIEVEREDGMKLIRIGLNDQFTGSLNYRDEKDGSYVYQMFGPNKSVHILDQITHEGDDQIEVDATSELQQDIEAIEVRSGSVCLYRKRKDSGYNVIQLERDADWGSV